MNSLAGKVIWLIALPNGGKSAIGRELKSRLSQYYSGTILIDGDDLRQALQMTNSHYDMASRIANGYRIGRLAKMFADQGSCVVVAANTLFKEVQDWNRKHLDYLEVYVSTDEVTRRARDKEKQLYSRYDSGEISNILGVDLPADIPENPDLIIPNTLNSSISSHIHKIIAYLGI